MSVTTSFEARQRLEAGEKLFKNGKSPSISAPFDAKARAILFDPELENADERKSKRSCSAYGNTKSTNSAGMKSPMSWITNMHGHNPLDHMKLVRSRKPKLFILREEKDRFKAMRNIQYSTRRFKRYFSLSMSIFACELLKL